MGIERFPASERKEKTERKCHKCGGSGKDGDKQCKLCEGTGKLSDS